MNFKHPITIVLTTFYLTKSVLHIIRKKSRVFNKIFFPSNGRVKKFDAMEAFVIVSTVLAPS